MRECGFCRYYFEWDEFPTPQACPACGRYEV